jgi:hypothetical protein
MSCGGILLEFKDYLILLFLSKCTVVFKEYEGPVMKKTFYV